MTEERLEEIRGFLKENLSGTLEDVPVDPSRAKAMIADLFEDRDRLIEARNNAIEGREGMEKRYKTLSVIGQESLTLVGALTNLQRLFAGAGNAPGQVDSVPADGDKVPVAQDGAKKDTEPASEDNGAKETQDA